MTQELPNLRSDIEIENSGWKNLYKISSSASLILGVLFFITALGFVVSIIWTTSKIWPLIAFALSLIAIILFIVTQNAGRSTIMLSTLIFSLIMLRNQNYNKATIYIGILASVFLFAGDLTVGIHSNIITLFFGIGYVLLTIWFFQIARTPLNTGNHKKVSIG